MNRPIRKVGIAFAVLFLALFVNLNYVQVVKGGAYRDDPRNQRVLLNEYSSPRGQIVVQNNTAIADSVKTHDELKYLREYVTPGPNGKATRGGEVYAPATGFYSFTYGASGIEDAENGILSGDSSKLFTTKLADLLTGRNPRGGSVQLTLNKAAQQAAYEGMKGSNGHYRPGAVVALDPTSGAILALVSTPSYDPNQLSSHNADKISHAYRCYVELDTARRAHETTKQFNRRIQAEIADREPHGRSKGCSDVPDDPTYLYKQNPYASSPLLNRAFDQLYPAGSIFKIIDSAAALKQGIKPDDTIPAPNAYWPLDPTRKDRCPASLNAPCVENFGGETCQNGTTATLAFAFAKSCNTAFAALANRVGSSKIVDQAHLFGFDEPYAGETPPNFCDPPAYLTPLAVCRSSPGSENDLNQPDSLAQTSFGQRDVRITPVQAAMLSAAVANSGALYQPYLVKAELRPNLSVLDKTAPKQIGEVIDPNLDQQLISLMEGVVTSPEGTGGPANITDLGPSVAVGGKTGTADTCQTSASRCQPDAWFTGFALVQGLPKIAVAVLLENGGVTGNEGEATGGMAAAPVAKQVMEAYLRSIGVS